MMSLIRFVVAFGMLSLTVSSASAQFVDGPQVGSNSSDLAKAAAASRMFGTRSHTHNGPVVGPYQAWQQQQMVQQQQAAQQAFASAQAAAQKKAEKKEKLRQNILIQKEKDAAKREALKEKNLAAAKGKDDDNDAPMLKEKEDVKAVVNASKK